MRYLTVDECPDALGHFTIREDDGSPNGSTATCVATVYSEKDAVLLAAAEHMAEALCAVMDKLDDHTLAECGVFRALERAGVQIP